ncbi:MAG: ATP-binding protein [Candidatus Riflebacteria bacterium]|nr:ATP-binding protein [Candidatus Riflebacteria bacterium]
MIIRKTYLKKIEPFLGKPIIKVISGVRRCGKSTLLKLLISKLVQEGIPSQQILLINMESMEFEKITDHRKLSQFVTRFFAKKRGKKFVFIDEIQEIPGWEKAVTSFLSDKVADIVITGSNAHLLASDLATLLAGRYVEIRVLPLGFKEFLQFRKKKPSGNLDEEFNLYLRYGGFPGIHSFPFSDEVIFQYLNGIFNTILMKDVVNRFEIRDANLLEGISRFIFDNCGNITTSKRIADFLKSQKRPASVETIQNYLSFLETAFLICKASRLDLKGLRLLELYEKYYVTDFGLRHGFLGFRPGDINGLLENVVFLELLRRGYKVCIGKLNQLEIDFVGERNGQRSYFQVSYLLSEKKTIEREFTPLEKIPDNFPKFVLSLDKVGPSERKGIFQKNLIKFLLEE